MEKVRPWCGQPSDRGRLKNRTELCVQAEQIKMSLRAEFVQCKVERERVSAVKQTAHLVTGVETQATPVDGATAARCCC